MPSLVGIERCELPAASLPGIIEKGEGGVLGDEYLHLVAAEAAVLDEA